MYQPPTKVVGRRLVGFILDTVILWVIGSVLFALLAKRQDTVPTGSNQVHVTVDNDQWVLQGSSYTLWIVLILVALLAIAVVLEGITGWTPGKLALGLRVVNAQGEVPGMPRAAARLIGWIVDGVPWVFLWGLTGLITASASKGNRRVGDMIGGTYVVRKEAIGRPVDVDGTAGGVPSGGYAAPTGQPSGIVVSTPSPGRDAFGNPVAPGHEGGVPASVGVRPAQTGVAPPAPTSVPATPSPSPAAAQAPADWYPDPSGKKRLRYWDGSVWTDHTAD